MRISGCRLFIQVDFGSTAAENERENYLWVRATNSEECKKVRRPVSASGSQSLAPQ